jgi:hypothetical protein
MLPGNASHPKATVQPESVEMKKETPVSCSPFACYMIPPVLLLAGRNGHVSLQTVVGGQNQPRQNSSYPPLFGIRKIRIKLINISFSAHNIS